MPKSIEVGSVVKVHLIGSELSAFYRAVNGKEVTVHRIIPREQSALVAGPIYQVDVEIKGRMGTVLLMPQEVTLVE